jgi:hypothetical protein
MWYFQSYKQTQFKANRSQIVPRTKKGLKVNALSP